MSTPGSAGFDDRILELMQAWRVPGCAVTVVRDGEPVLARGYGVRGLDDATPVGADTPFAIASATKPFTATAIGMLVDEGRLAWDRPLRAALPDLAMPTPELDERATAEDLLAHRTGVPYYLPWWINSPLSRARFVERFPLLAVVDGLRRRFRYNNLMYLLAGHLVDRIAEVPWERFLRERIFLPLRMRRTTATIEETARADDAAGPHRIAGDRLERVPFVPLGAASPCGGICSTAADMAGWLAAQLGRGGAGGIRLLEPGTHERMRRPLVAVPGSPGIEGLAPADYGLGWWVQRWRGELMVHHAGDYQGMSSYTSYLPERGLAAAVLANVQSSPLPAVATFAAYEELLGFTPAPWSGRFLAEQRRAARLAARERESWEAEADPGSPLSLPPGAYRGTYEHPAFGRVGVALEADRLTFSYNGLDYRLRSHRGDTLGVEGWQPGCVFREISFEREGDAIVAAFLSMDPEVPAARFARAAA